MEEYLVPAGFAEAEFTEKRSRFLGRIWRAETEREALERVRETREAFPDATHHCWAYVLRGGATRFSDDGEPGGTAGLPMAQVLQKEALFDAVCVVTRWFGGTLLGAGGLVRAYTRGAKLAVDAAGKSAMRLWLALRVACPYALYEQVRRAAHGCGGIVRGADFGAQVVLDALLPEAQAAQFVSALTNLSAGTLEAVETGREFRPTRNP